MRQYELMMIINPDLTEGERTDLITTIETEITQAGTTVVSRDHGGEKDLAYRIHGSTKGYYLLYILESERGEFGAVSKSFNIKTNIWRFMFVRIDE
jgi:small subunit ribosomal protein S6